MAENYAVLIPVCGSYLRVVGCAQMMFVPHLVKTQQLVRNVMVKSDVMKC